MSAIAQVALLPPAGSPPAAARALGGRAGSPAVRPLAFAALALYGTLRWETLLTGSSWHLRLLGLFALSVAVAALGTWLRGRGRALVGLLVLAAFVVMLALGGIPVGWLVHARVAVVARQVGDGVSALPRLEVPYHGLNHWARIVVTLGGGALALGAAATLALERRAAGGLRRAAPALPLLVLAAIPTTLVRPSFAYMHGLLVFVLLAAFLWGERVRRHDAPAALLVCLVAGVAGAALAPAIDRHRPWFDYQRLTETIAAQRLERFDWTQGYGPITWPRYGRGVLLVQARRVDYWKAENLDLFVGRGWSQASLLAPGSPAAGIDRASLRRWTQTLTVTVQQMSTNQVIAAGTAARPVGLSGLVLSGASPGTWVSADRLGVGDTYRVRVYDPQPTAAELERAGTRYPRSVVPSYLSLTVPTTPGRLVPNDFAQVQMTPFGSDLHGEPDPATAFLLASPYASAYELALRLRRQARTPYEFARAVLRYLGRGFSYDENPAPARYPLLSFLLRTRAGYCQQFAGAMALLLRLGGVPARVAVGFTSGSYDQATRAWQVIDTDAHAWVEAFFPHYGWVRFDPSPASQDPALSGLQVPVGIPAGSSSAGQALPHRAPPGRPGGLHRRPPAGASGPAASIVTLLLVGFGIAGALAIALTLTRPLEDPEALVAELERAFSRSGRPLAGGATLASIEARLEHSPTAAGYVRALRLARFAHAPAAPTPAQRRAVRATLRYGLGPAGRVRAAWALPPRRRARSAPGAPRPSSGPGAPRPASDPGAPRPGVGPGSPRP